ncbi:MAG: tRNA guanosine(15) transglycosylase TgtA [Candidatus Odinarchaeota archaeon]
MIEIIHKDLLARISRFRTKTGIVETPTFIPVVHPTRVLIPPRRMFEDFNCETIITNAYLLSKTELEGSIHEILDYPGTIMTDSGAYQLLVYGDVKTTPLQIIQFQEKIESDIAVILDVPTGGNAVYKEAQETVEETIRRARASTIHRTKPNILWVGPIQGGTFTDLVEKCAKEINKLDFSIFAIGSPTQLMEQYQFDKLVDLVLTAKRNISANKPVHLFGAGHPLIFPLIVAMGCDMFDSAAYAIFAKHDRILSSEGTFKLEEIKDDFCFCPTCSQFTVSEIKQLEKKERIQVLAEHNLRICQQEIIRIKAAIREGRLWRLVESRLSSHPTLVDAMKKFTSYHKLFERFSPVTKKKAIFITSQWSLYQPEIIRHKTRMTNYTPPKPKRKTLLFISAPQTRPYRSAKTFERFKTQFELVSSRNLSLFDILFLSQYFGLVPLELTDVYPLAQNEPPKMNLLKDQNPLIEQISQYVARNRQYHKFYAIFDSTENWFNFSQRCKRVFKKLEKELTIFHTDFSLKSLKNTITKLTTSLDLK